MFRVTIGLSDEIIGLKTCMDTYILISSYAAQLFTYTFIHSALFTSLNKVQKRVAVVLVLVVVQGVPYVENSFSYNSSNC